VDRRSCGGPGQGDSGVVARHWSLICPRGFCGAPYGTLDDERNQPMQVWGSASPFLQRRLGVSTAHRQILCRIDAIGDAPLRCRQATNWLLLSRPASETLGGRDVTVAVLDIVFAHPNHLDRDAVHGLSSFERCNLPVRNAQQESCDPVGQYFPLPYLTRRRCSHSSDGFFWHWTLVAHSFLGGNARHKVGCDHADSGPAQAGRPDRADSAPGCFGTAGRDSRQLASSPGTERVAGPAIRPTAPHGYQLPSLSHEEGMWPDQRSAVAP